MTSDGVPIAMILPASRHITRSEKRITACMMCSIMMMVMWFSDRVMCLDAGKIIALGTPAEVMADRRVQEAYLGT